MIPSALIGLAVCGVYPGADEQSPSRAHYCTWINNTNEGSTEAQTLVNLDFFKWLRDEYGMQLDIYAWDAGNFDGAARTYGSLNSGYYKEHYPRGFDPIYRKADSIGCRLGIWGGPDGFGDTPEAEQERIDTMSGFCRKYHFELFKFDGVCGTLRPEKVPAFIRMMEECRKYSPDLILLNHRLDLGEGLRYATTFLWEGAETYIDVHMANDTTAPHHRGGAIARGLTPNLERLAEDHGVCLSSCLDYWEDDLVLQAFNRCLILAPEIYGNPWLLRDDEFPRLARLFSLHRRYRDILMNGMVLDEARYGANAVSRGDGRTRFITLRNLSWKPATYHVKLDRSIGLTEDSEVKLRRLHPRERILGRFRYGSEAAVEVEPFRSCLLMAAVDGSSEIGVSGCDYEIVRDTKDKPVVVKLLGMPGTRSTVKVVGDRRVKSAELDGKPADAVLLEAGLSVDFPGEPLRSAWHRKLGDLSPCDVPSDAEALYESTCFAADNNALEVRSLERSGETGIPAVRAARDAFFNQTTFVSRGVWDKYMFDGKTDTFFSIWREETDLRIRGGSLRVDFGEPLRIDRLVIKAVQELTESAEVHYWFAGSECEAEVSNDLVHWTPVTFRPREALVDEQAMVPIAKIKENGGVLNWGRGRLAVLEADIPEGGPIRYLRMPNAPDRVSEIEGHFEGKMLDRSKWRGSNLFAPYATAPAVAAWSGKFRLDEAGEASYLCVALNGKHGSERAYAAVRLKDGYVGSSDRSVSYPSVVWEWLVRSSDSNYTYYIPVTHDLVRVDFEVVVLGLEGGETEIRPEVWVTCQSPLASRELVLSEE